MEPIEWAAVAEAIAKGVAAYVGEKALEQLFSGGRPDLRDLLSQAVEEIETRFRVSLAQDDKMKIDASCVSLQNLYLMYLSNRDKNYLQDTLFKVDEFVEQAYALGLVTAGAFVMSGSVELAILEERHNRGFHGEVKNIVERAKALIKESTVFRPMLVKANNARFLPDTIFQLV